MHWCTATVAGMLESEFAGASAYLWSRYTTYSCCSVAVHKLAPQASAMGSVLSDLFLHMRGHVLTVPVTCVNPSLHVTGLIRASAEACSCSLIISVACSNTESLAFLVWPRYALHRHEPCNHSLPKIPRHDAEATECPLWGYELCSALDSSWPAAPISCKGIHRSLHKR
jgi:hypothetical protein